MSSQAVDLFVLYKIIKDISTPFKDTDAYKLGLVDDKGKKLKSASTQEEREAITYYDRFVFNIKRALSKVGLDNRIGTYAGALFLLRESENTKQLTEREILQGIQKEMNYLEESTLKSFDEFIEDAPAMATGPAVVGTGDDPVHWRHKGRPRIKGKPIDGYAFIKRMNKKRAAKI